MDDRHVPTPASTYRLQIRPSWDLYAATELCAYLSALGVDGVYMSPLLPSVTGSEHGYDVTAWDTIDPQRGGEDGWHAFLAATREHDLRVVVDIVPNHCAASPQTAAWASVVEFGERSRYADWFDIEWRGGQCVHYRRFFAVDGLAGLRQEDPRVFEATHATVARWVGEDGVDGLRVDHPDGLTDPRGYFDRLRELVGDDCWIVAEKVLEPGEDLEPDWPVDGTTGYDALNELTHLLVDPQAESALTDMYRVLVDDKTDFAECAAASKREIATGILRPEVERLARLAPTVEQSVEALTELLVAFTVYRTYLPGQSHFLAIAITNALDQAPELQDEISELAARLDDPSDELCRRFQQTSGAVMAKGIEDTAFYRYNRFAALNEVGGDPAEIGAPVDHFHAAAVYRQSEYPTSMTTLSTHDTKRSEDVRARMAVLAEIPEQWSALAAVLMRTAPLQDASFAFLLWQTFAGVGFIDRGRMHSYAEKAMREAGLSTTWAAPNADFEDAVHAVVDRAYDDPGIRGPLEDLLTRITPPGWSNSLSQKLIQLTMPGVPDVYQGTEVWDYSLVDPDNRRRVDFDALSARLSAIDAANIAPPIDASADAKLWITSRALRLRRDRPELFEDYEPMDAEGAAARHAVVFDRGGAITIATRLPVGLEQHGGWGATHITLEGAYRDVLTQKAPVTGRVRLAELLDAYPVALLIKDDQARS
jgi:(1->4)-alpha-D-glucan 1-alpha-D-glucosylmutase